DSMRCEFTEASLKLSLLPWKKPVSLPPQEAHDSGKERGPQPDHRDLRSQDMARKRKPSGLSSRENCI
ncbi:hypothetical protein P7K49_010439, partial [Saguinus oedipus]